MRCSHGKWRKRSTDSPKCNDKSKAVPAHLISQKSKIFASFIYALRAALRAVAPQGHFLRFAPGALRNAPAGAALKGKPLSVVPGLGPLLEGAVMVHSGTMTGGVPYPFPQDTPSVSAQWRIHLPQRGRQGSLAIFVYLDSLSYHSFSFW